MAGIPPTRRAGGAARIPLRCWTTRWCTTGRSPPMTPTAAAWRCMGIHCTLLTDTEVITYIIDYLHRASRGSPWRETASGAWRRPSGSTIDRMPEAERERYDLPAQRYIAALLITGPFSILVGFDGRHDGPERPAEAAQHGGGRRRDDRVYMASEECAIRRGGAGCWTGVWAPRGRTNR